MTDTKVSRYDNWQLEVKEGKLVITVDLDETRVDAQESKSGKSIVIATTGSHQRVPGTPCKLNLTLYRRK